MAINIEPSEAAVKACADGASEIKKVETVGNSVFAYGSQDACQSIKQELVQGMVFYSPYLNLWVYTTYEENVEFVAS